MKQFDDKQIISTIKKDTNYQIKTTSADILRKYRSTVAEPVKEKRSHKGFFIFGGFGVALATAAALLVVVGAKGGLDIGGEQPGILQNPTITNNSFQEQLIAFSAFTHASEADTSIQHLLSSQMLRGAKPVDKVEEDEEKPEEETHITEPQFQDVCRTYDNLSHSLVELHKETEFKGYEFNKELEGETYKYVNEIYFKGEEQPFAKMYFNSEALVTEEDGETEFEALYFADEHYYNVKIEKEVEISATEKESEYKLKFKSRGAGHSYEIKKENEFEQVESESCYSYTTYSDNEFKNVNYSLLYKSEIEAGKEKIELKLIKDNKEYLFKDIIQEKTSLSFKASLEDPIGTKVAENVFIEGIIETTATTYKHDSLTIVI